jgi:Nif-specific regulatory protein
LLYDKVIGLIYLVTRNLATRFDEDHLQLLTAIAGMAAVALQNARHFEALHSENRRLQNEINLQHNMVGDSPAMQEVLQFIARAAPRDTTVLIRGESGTGKELVARAIHQNSPRRDKPFQAINCAALAESLLESELFGYERGAFTNALNQKKGKLEVADGGTVFLDEVGELAPALQAKLLRVLQEREFDRVGGTRPVSVNVRIVAATNKNLEEALRQGTFRQDLYFRLNVISLTMPPLRDRPQDISLLAHYFIEKFSKKSGRRVNGLSPEAKTLLVHYDWPGNVRELENAIERAVVLGASPLVLPEDLPEVVLEKEAGTGVPLAKYHEMINETKKQTIIKAFESAGGSYTETAHLLGLHPNYLHRLIRNLDLKLVLKQKAGGPREARPS